MNPEPHKSHASLTDEEREALRQLARAKDGRADITGDYAARPPTGSNRFQRQRSTQDRPAVGDGNPAAPVQNAGTSGETQTVSGSYRRSSSITRNMRAISDSSTAETLELPAMGEETRRDTAGLLILGAITALFLCAVALMMHNFLQKNELSEALRLSRSFLKHGNTQLAKAQLDPLVEAQAKHPDVYALHGLCASQLGEPDTAIASFERALTILPANALFRVGKAQALLLAGRRKEAIEESTLVLEQNPRLTEALRVRAEARAGEGQLPEALEDTDAYLAANPDAPADLYATRAFVLFKLKRFESAAADYERALKVDPHNSHLIASKATALKQAKQFEQAIAACQSAMSLAGTTPDLLRLRASCYFLSNQRELALKDMETLCEMLPNKQSYVDCAEMALQMQRFNLAAHYFGKAIEADPGDASLQEKRSLALRNVRPKQFRLADTVSEERLSQAYLNQASAGELAQRGLHLFNCGDSANALLALAAAVEKSPQDVNSRRYLVDALLAQEQTAEALNQVSILHHGNHMTRDDALRYADGFYKNKNASGLICVLTPFLEKDPDDFQIRSKVIQAYMLLGKSTTAVRLAHDGLSRTRDPQERTVLSDYIRAANQRRNQSADSGPDAGA